MLLQESENVIGTSSARRITRVTGNGGPRVVRGRTFVNGSSKDKARLMRKEREDGKFLL
jgi:hypothetical protein